MTDQETWELILKWKRLIYKKAARIAGPQRDLVNDVAHTIMLDTYASIQRGYLEKGTIGQIIGFSAARGRQILIKKYVARVAMSRVLVCRQKVIQRELLDNTYTGCRTHDPPSIEDATVVALNAVVFPREVDIELISGKKLYKKPTWLLTNPFRCPEEVTEHQLDFAAALSALKRLWDTNYSKRRTGYSFYYTIARFYSIEQEIINILPDVFSEEFWLDNYETEDDAREAEKLIMTGALIGQELNISRERVRQMLAEIHENLREELR